MVHKRCKKKKDIIPALGNVHHLPAGQPCLGVHTVNVTLGHVEGVQSENEDISISHIGIFGYFIPVSKLDSNQCLSGSLHISKVWHSKVANYVVDWYSHLIVANPCYLQNL